MRFKKKSFGMLFLSECFSIKVGILQCQQFLTSFLFVNVFSFKMFYNIHNSRCPVLIAKENFAKCSKYYKVQVNGMGKVL